MRIDDTIRLYKKLSATNSIMYKPNSETLRQIAAWLEELKDLRKRSEKFEKNLLNKLDYNTGYYKALDDMLMNLKQKGLYEAEVEEVVTRLKREGFK